LPGGILASRPLWDKAELSPRACQCAIIGRQEACLSELPIAIIAAIIVFPTGLVFLLGTLSWFLLAWRPPRRPSRIRAQSLARGSFTREQLERPWQVHRLPSSHGYDLVIRFLPGRGRRVALFHHGVRWNWMGAIKYAEAFIRDGWTVVAYDARGHGETLGLRPSFGYFEKDDLLSVADWIFERFHPGDGFVLHGESLGASSILQYAPLDPRVDAIIADCPFTSAGDILRIRLRALGLPYLILPPVSGIARMLIRLLEGWRLEEASPARACLETEAPILFIHGLADSYVPFSMSKAMAEERIRLRPDTLTRLWLVPRARHAASFKADPADYEEAVMDFIRLALAQRRPAALSRDEAAGYTAAP
jgi:hypothetical protein